MSAFLAIILRFQRATAVCDGQQTDENSLIFIAAKSRSLLCFKCNAVFKSNAALRSSALFCHSTAAQFQQAALSHLGFHLGLASAMQREKKIKLSELFYQKEAFLCLCNRALISSKDFLVLWAAPFVPFSSPSQCQMSHKELEVKNMCLCCNIWEVNYCM